MGNRPGHPQRRRSEAARPERWDTSWLTKEQTKSTIVPKPARDGAAEAITKRQDGWGAFSQLNRVLQRDGGSN